MKKFHVIVEYIEEVLGTASANKELHSEFIASKAPDAPSMKEEIAALGADAVEEKGMTVFPRMEDGTPFLWDYQWKGFCKDACSMLRKADGSKSAGLKAYKKEIDGLIFFEPRKIPLVLPEGGEVGERQRPLRAQTAQGERIALAHSETVPAGTRQEFDIVLLKDSHLPIVAEWLQYGELRGVGQWRNSGCGRFKFAIVDQDGEKLAGNL